jgi:hypothetical protein
VVVKNGYIISQGFGIHQGAKKGMIGSFKQATKGINVNPCVAEQPL